MSTTTSPAQANEVIRAALAEGGIDWEENAEGVFDVVLPGEKKLKTPVRLEVGIHALAIHAFVCRKPDENHAVVYRWLLERNLKMFGMAFAVDHLGDIFLESRLPLSVVSAPEIDRLLGSALAYADDSFNTILELGFATAIRKEWEWRTANGESTANLDAFKGWLTSGADPVPPSEPTDS